MLYILKRAGLATVVIGLMLVLVGCGSPDPETPPTIAPTSDEAETETDETETDQSETSEATDDKDYYTGFTVSGDVNATVENGSYYTEDYDPNFSTDYSAFNLILFPDDSVTPALGFEVIPRSANTGDTLTLAIEPDGEQVGLYFQEQLSSADGVYARAVSGELTLTFFDGETVSGEFTAELVPAIASGGLREGTDDAYTVTGSFENIPVAQESTD